MPRIAIPTYLLVPLACVAGLVVVLLVAGRVPVRYNGRNLAVRWVTTAVTVVAFTLVIGLLTVMLAFVNGMYRLTAASGHSENVVVLSEGATDESFSNLVPADTADVERQPGVLACSREVYVIAAQPLPTASGQPQHSRFVQVRGIDDPAVAATVHGIELQPGGAWFSPAGVEEISPREPGGRAETAIEAVLGDGVARTLGADAGKERLAVGDVFALGPRKWKVVGVMSAALSTFGSEVWAKRSLVADLYGKPNYSSLVLRTAGAAQARAVAHDLTANFRKANLEAQPETEYYSKLSATNVQFLFAAVFLTVFMAIGGVFGVMNTMFAAISQRARDIAVLRILGFSRRQVLVSFLLESVLLALIGGVVGCAVGYLADGWSATSVVSSGTGGFGKTIVLRLAVDARILAAGMLLALGMGVVGGLLPALAAVRVRPLESLR